MNSKPKNLDELKALLIEEFKKANGNYLALELFDANNSQDLMKTNRDFMQNESTTEEPTTTTTEGDFEEMLDTGFGNLIRASYKERTKLIKGLRTNIVEAFGDGPAPPKTLHELKTQLIEEFEKPNGIYLALKLLNSDDGRHLVYNEKKLGLGLLKKEKPPRNAFEVFLKDVFERLCLTPVGMPWGPIKDLRKGIIFARKPQTLDELKVQLIEESEKPDGLTLVLNLFDTPNSQQLMKENTVYHQDPLSPYTPPYDLKRILDFNFKIFLDSRNVDFRSKWTGQLRNEIEEFMLQRYGPKSLNQLKTKLIELSKETDGLKRVMELFDGFVGSRLMKTNGMFSPDIIDGGSILETMLNIGFQDLVQVRAVDESDTEHQNQRLDSIKRLRTAIVEALGDGPKSLNDLKAQLIKLSKETDGLKRVMELFDGLNSFLLMRMKSEFSKTEIDGGRFLEKILDAGFETLIKAPQTQRHFLIKRLRTAIRAALGDVESVATELIQPHGLEINKIGRLTFRSDGVKEFYKTKGPQGGPSLDDLYQQLVTSTPADLLGVFDDNMSLMQTATRFTLPPTTTTPIDRLLSIGFQNLSTLQINKPRVAYIERIKESIELFDEKKREGILVRYVETGNLATKKGPGGYVGGAGSPEPPFVSAAGIRNSNTTVESAGSLRLPPFAEEVFV